MVVGSWWLIDVSNACCLMIAIAVSNAVDVVGVIDVAVVAIDVVDIVVGLFSVRGSGPG